MDVKYFFQARIQKPRKTPKGRKETQFALVDKLRFFSGGGRGILNPTAAKGKEADVTASFIKLYKTLITLFPVIYASFAFPQFYNLKAKVAYLFLQVVDWLMFQMCFVQEQFPLHPKFQVD